MLFGYKPFGIIRKVIESVVHQFSWNSKRRETFKSEIDKSITETVKITTSIEYIELTTCTKKKNIYILDRIITL